MTQNGRAIPTTSSCPSPSACRITSAVRKPPVTINGSSGAACRMSFAYSRKYASRRRVPAAFFSLPSCPNSAICS